MGNRHQRFFRFGDLVVAIDLYEAWDKPEKAKEWRAKLLETEAVDE